MMEEEAVRCVQSDGLSTVSSKYRLAEDCSSDCDLSRSLLSAFSDAVRQHGGPKQFLNSIFPMEATRRAHAQALLRQLPLQDDLEYAWLQELRTSGMDCYARDTPQHFHIAFFGWSDACSSKLFPEASACIKLATEIVQDGFVTASEPLLAKPAAQLAAWALARVDCRPVCP